MTTRISVLKFLRNLVAGTVLGGLGLGTLGFLFAGEQGLINLARLGLIIGFVGSFSLGFTTFSVLHIFTECIQKYGSWWFKKSRKMQGHLTRRRIDLMTGRISILKFLIVLVGGTALGGLALGIFGFLLAGKEGFVNMAYWGLAIGFLGGISNGFAMLIGVHYWTGYAERFGKSWFKKVSEGEDKKSNY